MLKVTLWWTCGWMVWLWKVIFIVWCFVTRIIQSLYYASAGRYINAWMHSLIKSVKPEIVNRYDLWVLRHRHWAWMARKIGEAKQVFVNNVQWTVKYRFYSTFCFSLNLKVYLSSKFAQAQSFSMFTLSILHTEVKEVTNAHTR